MACINLFIDQQRKNLVNNLEIPPLPQKGKISFFIFNKHLLSSRSQVIKIYISSSIKLFEVENVILVKVFCLLLSFPLIERKQIAFGILLNNP